MMRIDIITIKVEYDENRIVMKIVYYDDKRM